MQYTTTVNYNSLTVTWLSEAEDFESTAYYDSNADSKPSIGYGFNLRQSMWAIVNAICTIVFVVLFLVGSTPASAFDSRPELYLRNVIDGDEEFCRLFLSYMRDVETVGSTLSWPKNSNFPQVSLPNWQNLRPNDHASILKQIYAYFGRGSEWDVSDEEWSEIYLPGIVKSMEEQNLKLQTARFDIDNGGEPETVYRLSYDFLSSLSPRDSNQLAPQGTKAWYYYLAEEERLKLAELWPKLGVNDFFIYQGQTHLVGWSFSEIANSIGISIPYIGENKTSGKSMYLFRLKCSYALPS